LGSLIDDSPNRCVPTFTRRLLYEFGGALRCQRRIEVCDMIRVEKVAFNVRVLRQECSDTNRRKLALEFAHGGVAQIVAVTMDEQVKVWRFVTQKRSEHKSRIDFAASGVRTHFSVLFLETICP